MLIAHFSQKSTTSPYKQNLRLRHCKKQLHKSVFKFKRGKTFFRGAEDLKFTDVYELGIRFVGTISLCGKGANTRIDTGVKSPNWQTKWTTQIYFPILGSLRNNRKKFGYFTVQLWEMCLMTIIVFLPYFHSFLA